MHLWLVCEVIIFYVGMSLYLGFGGYFAYAAGVKRRRMKFEGRGKA